MTKLLVDGQTFRHVAETYEQNVCDFCGRYCMCDWFENEAFDRDCVTGYDVCRRCQKAKKAEGVLLDD